MPPRKKRTTKKQHHMKRFFLGYVVTFVAIFAFGGGVLFERASGIGCCNENAHAQSSALSLIAPANGLLNEDIDTDLYWKVWSLVQSRFVDRPVEDSELFYGSLKGMVDALGDPYSTFLPPQTAERFTSDLQGKFFGIGAEIGFRNERLTVIAPLPDSPAERAGLQPGDNIATIDGEETFNMSIEEAVDRIRGPKGTEVVLGLYRNGFEDIKDISIVRGEIVIKSVEWDISDGVMNLKVSQFGADTMDLFSDAVREAHAQGINGVILDLRNNPGGFLTTAVQMASEWIPEGPIVIERFSDGSVENYMREGKLRLHGIRTVVLVNGGSASGSEIVAGALQDYGAATLIGQKTFGKGSVQDLESLPDGSAVKITIAKWFTPLDRGIDGEGVEPDIVVEPDDNLERDIVLEKALELLK